MEYINFNNVIFLAQDIPKKTTKVYNKSITKKPKKAFI